MHFVRLDAFWRPNVSIPAAESDDVRCCQATGTGHAVPSLAVLSLTVAILSPKTAQLWTRGANLFNISRQDGAREGIVARSNSAANCGYSPFTGGRILRRPVKLGRRISELGREQRCRRQRFNYLKSESDERQGRF
jgi:hypothetical protein